jgi:hypothetical protein
MAHRDGGPLYVVYCGWMLAKLKIKIPIYTVPRAD